MAWVSQVLAARPPPPMELPPIRVWQKKAIRLLDEQTNRQILFVVGAEGGEGKSTFGDYLCRNSGYIKLPNKTAEAAFLFTGQVGVVFDFSRSSAEHINYDSIEQVINFFFVLIISHYFFLLD